MGKTEGNMVTLEDSADNMFGKVMSWPDEMILLGLEICTDWPKKKIEEMEQAMKAGANPRDFKLILAEEIVKIYKGREAAEEAKANFIKIFQQKAGPEEVESLKVKSKKLMEVLVETKIVASNSEAKRVIREGGVKVDEKVITDINSQLTSGEHLIQKGKRFFVKVIVG